MGLVQRSGALWAATTLSANLEEKGGYEVHVHHTGEACLANLGEHPDFIILDYYLDSDDAQAQNGLEILKKIRKAKSEAKVIMLSSQEHYGVAAQTIATGAL